MEIDRHSVLFHLIFSPFPPSRTEAGLNDLHFFTMSSEPGYSDCEKSDLLVTRLTFHWENTRIILQIQRPYFPRAFQKRAWVFTNFFFLFLFNDDIKQNKFTRRNLKRREFIKHSSYFFFFFITYSSLPLRFLYTSDGICII